MNELVSNQLANRISELLISARTKVLQTVNNTMVLTYFEIGRMIVEEEQNGKQRADYGKQLISDLSKKTNKRIWQRFFHYEYSTKEAILFGLFKTADTVC